MFQIKNEEQAGVWRVLALAVAAFIFNTTEFIPVALLSDIGATFAMPVADTGLMMTVYAWTVSLMSLPFMLMTAKWERRRLLIVLFAVFIVGHILTVLAWRFEVLLLARIVVALAHSVFWAITAALVMRVAPKGKEQLALSWLSMGSSLAMILGLPLGRILGQMLGWRSTFVVIAIMALIILFLLWKLLPKLPSENSGSLKSLPLLAQRPMLLSIYAITAIGVTAHFTTYSYIEPFMLQIGNINPNMTTVILLMFGISGMVASWLFGRFHQRQPYAFMVAALVLMMLSLVVLLPFSGSPPALFAVVITWGLGIGCLTLSMLVRVLQYASDATDVATAIYSGIFNIGIGGGALLGGMVMKHSGLGNIAWVSSALALLALMIFVCAHRKYGSNLPSGNSDTPILPH
ncbi:sugar transporter [Alysiella filiformis]|uniref:MFS transporter, DHA1 family, L-arabinose/isopropyl-beta-D-thiogalactopyranoside export protein n=1 Tax=Alysiella filiformis DSM 16848 TaxID=1120981 RepID=A0A286EHR5_9NEIS|nr:sugar transporter [Alysiella filiformis]QMT32335.1 sugar transporter [Alysiella filiformis]UBQ56745.1 sugar transporter [Alysiella filiformis DSM 16848]SOD70359.1 MFS transporter, DHA1 family, L-arabinose/isopropyl-beta-D-thiogalactopyranoside export protein [Alysiella filiformis DSM 16848]